MKVKNITLAVPEDVYHAARIRAAEQGTSVSRLVSEYLASLTDARAEFKRLERQQHLIQERIQSFSAETRLTREELYDRALR